mgnify:CR=1 FL=1
MPSRQLGRSILRVSPLCFGGNVFGWTVDADQSFTLLDAWLDAGFNFVDTADVYSIWAPGHTGGESERIIGQWLRRSGRRQDLVLATKVGKPMGPDQRGLKADYIRKAVEDSLQRLQTDYIDLYQSHDDDLDTPLEETLAAFDALHRAGKIRAIGASNYTAKRLAAALKVSADHQWIRYESLQPLYNLYDRPAYEGELQDLCVNEGLGVINFYTLAAGFLTGKYRSPQDAAKSARGKNTVAKYLNDRGLKILRALDQVATMTGQTPAAIATAWSIARPSVTAPIVSATSLDQLEILVQAARLRLDGECMAILDAASA